MKVPVSWLRDYVAFTAPIEDVADRLAVATAEVERIVRRGVPDTDGNLGLYRVGRVVEAGKHPNADRLQLCRVDVGEAEPRQIVCGAWNFGAGATVAVALPGALLPDGRTLERAKLRGTVSDGMILSERELELGADHAGILVLPESWEPGTPLADVLPVADAVLELEVTPNRPDLLSVYGLAREIAVLYRLELSPPPGIDPPLVGDETPAIAVEDFEGCPRYIGRLFRDVQIAAAPPWLRARLLASGVRAISNVVDVTNYVMLALGSPLHVFDHDTLGGGKIIVRRARPGEELTTLDETARRLEPDDLVIADAERAIAFAAIMGGLDTEVRDGTTSVLLEAANFEPIGILRTSERHALRTEGSNRWEKGVDPYLAEQAAVLATQLLVETAGARYVGNADVHAGLPERPVVNLRPEQVGVVTGLEVSVGEQQEILVGIGCALSPNGDWIVPTWRSRDLRREIDLVEEVARIHGLEQIPFTLPTRTTMFGRLTREQKLRRRVEDVLSGIGFSEAYTWSLVRADPDPNALRLPVPMTADHAILRTTLLEGLVDTARRNVNAGNDGIALFEIARVYLPSGDPLPEERWRVGGIVEGGFFRAKGAVEALHDALHVEASFVRAAGAVSPSRQGRAHPIRLGWGASSDAPGRHLGSVRARPRDALRRRTRPDPLRGRDHVPGRPPGPRLRRRRGRARGRARRRRPRGGRAGAARGPCLRRLPGRPGGRRSEVGSDRRGLQVLGTNALRRGRTEAASADRGRARGAIRGRAPRLADLRRPGHVWASLGVC